MQDLDHNHTTVPPHSYPTWIIMSTLLLLSSIIYSLKSFPDYFAAAKAFNLATSKYNEGNYNESIKHFQSVLEMHPTSRKAKIAIAKAYFSIADKQESEAGLSYLSDISLSEYEWKDIIKVMPFEYQKQFVKK